MSANADYGVKIVESFAPPANWLPGQKVEKDVYATNTGNIGAFVKETVSGTLSLTIEKDTNELTDDSVKLTEEERYSIEAGAYLAYKPAGDTTNEVGNIVVVRPADETFPRKTDFTPAANGLYVFRRSIGVGNDTKETFKYDGYYYKDGDYYKISNLTYSLASAANLGGDNVNDDGNLASASAGFVEVKTIVANPTSLEYVELDNNTEADAANVENNKKYLVAKYNIGSDNAQAKLKALAEAYDKAIHDFEYADELVTAATTKSGSSSDETDVALNALNNAKDVYDQAIADYDAAFRADVAAKQTLANATAAKERAEQAYNEALGAYNTAVTAQSAAEQAITNAGYTGDDADDAALNTELAAWWNDVNISGEYNRGSLTVEQLEAFKTYIDAKYGTDAEKHTHYTLLANKAIADRKVADAEVVKDAAELTKNKAISDYSAADEAVNSVFDPNAPIGDASTSSGDGTQKLLENAAAAKNDAKTAYDNALNEYKTKLAASNADTTQLDNATKALAAATAAKDAAATAYTTAAGAIGSASDGQLKIWIKLSDYVNTFDGTADKWQMLPDSVDPTTNKAVFYYTTILEGGETSSKLIDSVTLDARTTQDMYKYFDFDLNVALDSVQVNYADDGKTLLAGGTASELGASVTFTDDTNVNAALTWS